MYAVAKRLCHLPEWEWTKDFIDDTSKYTRLLYALRTSKSMGPKYKFGVEVPRSVKHALTELPKQKLAFINVTLHYHLNI